MTTLDICVGGLLLRPFSCSISTRLHSRRSCVVAKPALGGGVRLLHVGRFLVDEHRPLVSGSRTFMAVDCSLEPNLLDPPSSHTARLT